MTMVTLVLLNMNLHFAQSRWRFELVELDRLDVRSTVIRYMREVTP